MFVLAYVCPVSIGKNIKCKVSYLFRNLLRRSLMDAKIYTNFFEHFFGQGTAILYNEQEFRNDIYEKTRIW